MNEQCDRRDCRGSAHWVDGDGWAVCEEHCLQYLREGGEWAIGIEEGDPVELGEDGEVRRAS